MADAPLNRQLSAGFTNPHLRAINNEYHLELVAKNTADIKAGQIAQRRVQYEAAAANQRALGLIHDSIENQSAGMRDGLGALSTELSYMSGQLDGIEDAVVEGFERTNITLNAGFRIVAGEIVRVVAALEKQQVILNEIAYTLHHPNETKALELLRNGRKLLKLAAVVEGREKIDTRKDALLRFREATKDNIGASNCVAWFNIGWIQWQLHQAKQPAEESFYNNPAEWNVTKWEGLPQAEQSFYNAQRYSAGSRDLWHTRSLRYQAEMQYLQGNHKDAWLTANKALGVQREYETIYNAARYASKTGLSKEQDALLDECIELRPSTIVTMFSEEDFLG